MGQIEKIYTIRGHLHCVGRIPTQIEVKQYGTSGNRNNETVVI